MAGADWKRAKEIFGEALERPVGERAAFVEGACAGDAAMRGQVESLLAALEPADGFMATRPRAVDGETSEVSTAALFAAVEADPFIASGQQIGPYRLLERLGEGGFGEVWLAERREPFVQRVAIKLIKPGMNSRAVLARFEQERQALAVMDHPNIAKVLDGGVTPAATGSRPFFVMEHVQGEPITGFCDRHRYTVTQRLELFVEVCDALQHAHHKGIIHRDLKPSNILVALKDQKSVPKVIDFGIAKAISQSLTDKTIYTQAGQFIGTPEYMSPEQAEMGVLDIDTRTDVYSLGVVLYELLTGMLPFDAGVLRAAGYDAIRRIIREQDPPKPSTRLTTADDATVAGICGKRQSEGESLSRELRRELDWIPLKAMRKDRLQRYRTPSDVADDIRRYLKGEALEAGPESAGYRFKKLVRRNRGLFMAAGAVGAALVLGIAGFAWQAYRLGVERDRAVAAERTATAERDRASAIKDYLIQMLQSSDPDSEGRQDILLTDAMLRGVERLKQGALSDQPLAKMEILSASASILYSNGDGVAALPLAEEALTILRRIHSGDHADVAEGLSTLGVVLYSVGRSTDAESVLAQSLDMRQRLFEGDHADIAESLSGLAFVRDSLGRSAEAEPLATRALEMRKRLFPGDHSEVATSLSTLSGVLENTGRTAEAERLCLQALEMRQRIHKGDHPNVAHALFNLARTRLELGRAAEAEPLLVQSLAMHRRLYKGDHPFVVANLYNLAAALTELSRTTEAVTAADEAVAMARRLFPSGHPMLARALWRAGNARLAAGNAAGALPLLEESVAVGERVEQPESPRLKDYHETLAKCREDLKGVPSDVPASSPQPPG